MVLIRFKCITFKRPDQLNSSEIVSLDFGVYIAFLVLRAQKEEIQELLNIRIAFFYLKRKLTLHLHSRKRKN